MTELLIVGGGFESESSMVTESSVVFTVIIVIKLIISATATRIADRLAVAVMSICLNARDVIASASATVANHECCV